RYRCPLRQNLSFSPSSGKQMPLLIFLCDRFPAVRSWKKGPNISPNGITYPTAPNTLKFIFSAKNRHKSIKKFVKKYHNVPTICPRPPPRNLPYPLLSHFASTHSFPHSGYSGLFHFLPKPGRIAATPFTHSLIHSFTHYTCITPTL